jgi:hypothetical protein
MLDNESVQLPRGILGSTISKTGPFDIETLVRKIESYLAITEQLFDLETVHTNSSLKMQLVRIGE